MRTLFGVVAAVAVMCNAAAAMASDHHKVFGMVSNLGPASCTVTIDLCNKCGTVASRTFQITGDTKVKLNGKHVALSDLRPGMPVEVKYTDCGVTEIKAKCPKVERPARCSACETIMTYEPVEQPCGCESCQAAVPDAGAHAADPSPAALRMRKL